MGQSDKPDIPYRVFDHINYIDKFIDALKLKSITFVLHGWGSVIGFECARRHADKVKAIAFYEAYLKPVTHFSQLSLPMQEVANLLHDAKRAYQSVVDQDTFIERILTIACMKKLNDEEMKAYTAPFQSPQSRLLLWQFLNDVPMGNGPDDVVQLMQNYSAWLMQTTFPKLMLYALPGFLTPIELVCWAKEHLKNLSLECLDNVLHFAQESDPKAFGGALVKWHENL